MSGSVFKVVEFSAFFGKHKILKDINIEIKDKSLTALVGPPRCGKSTFLGSLNRINELVEGYKVLGQVLLDNENIYEPKTDLIGLRRKVGLVFPRPNPFPKSVYDNVAYGPRLHGCPSRETLDGIVEKSLAQVGLWKCVRDRLFQSALRLSTGEQQLLCLARLLAINPRVILLDEVTSLLDPVYSLKIEELLLELKNEYAIIFVTKNIQQAARVSDDIALFLFGELVEFGNTGSVLTRPKDKRTEDYISGRLG